MQVAYRILPEERAVCHLVLIGRPLPVALPTYLVIAAFTAAFYWYLYQGNSRPGMNGADEMQRAIGKVLSVNGRLASVWIRSELWSANYEGELREGDRVQVIGMEGLRLRVRKLDRGPTGAATID